MYESPPPHVPGTLDFELSTIRQAESRHEKTSRYRCVHPKIKWKWISKGNVSKGNEQTSTLETAISSYHSSVPVPTPRPCNGAVTRLRYFRFQTTLAPKLGVTQLASLIYPKHSEHFSQKALNTSPSSHVHTTNKQLYVKADVSGRNLGREQMSSKNVLTCLTSLEVLNDRVVELTTVRTVSKQ